MLQNKDQFLLISLPQACIYIFICLQIIAMLVYPGGTYFDLESSQYSLTRNFLSDLGRYKSFSGENNFISCQLFNMSLIMAGGVFIIFYYKVATLFALYNKLARLGSILGGLGGFSLIAVGLTPSDLYFSLHVISAKFIFRFFLLTAIIFSWLIFKSKIINFQYAVGYIIFTILLLIYLIISEFGPSPKSNELALTFQVISQKLILIVMILSVYWQTTGIKINFFNQSQ